MARQEAAIAAATAAAERKALRKAERWAMAVGGRAPLPRVRARPTSRTARSASARRIRFSPHAPTRACSAPLGSLDTVRKDVLSPSKRVAWNLKRNTRHTPRDHQTPRRGEGLRALLGSTAHERIAPADSRREGTAERSEGEENRWREEPWREGIEDGDDRRGKASRQGV